MTSRIRGARLRVAAVIASFVIFMVPGSALAHAELVRSIPADGETVTEPVTVVSATYSQDLAANSKLRIYPNPTRGLLYYEMKDNIHITHAAILSTTGQLMKEYNPMADKAELDVSDMPHGMYFLRLTDAAGQQYIRSYLME